MPWSVPWQVLEATVDHTVGCDLHASLVQMYIRYLQVSISRVQLTRGKTAQYMQPNSTAAISVLCDVTEQSVSSEIQPTTRLPVQKASGLSSGSNKLIMMRRY